MRAMRPGALAFSPSRGTVGRATAELLPPAALALAMAALIFIVPPAGDFPINDDWDYARVVQSLVERGQLARSEVMAPSFVLQAYWGSLFVHAFGFSHTVLRSSTLVLAAAGVIGYYVLLRHLLDPSRAALGALLLLLNPLFVNLSYSFMTDVPFLALVLWALVCYVRALPAGSRPKVGWLVVGSTFAGGAYLVRQLGLALPVAALAGMLVAGGWRVTLRPLHLAAVLGPVLPSMLIGAYLDSQRGPLKHEPLGWTLAFWAEHGLGMAGVLLVRLEETFSTLGLFTLPLCLGALAGRPALALRGRRRWLAGLLLSALLVGFVVRSATFREKPLFPHLGDILTPRGFLAFDEYYNGTLPESLIVPESVLALTTAAALVGSGFLVLAVVAAPSRKTVHGPIAVPLLFGLLALILTVPYYAIADRYLMLILPIALLVMLLPFRRARRGPEVALVGVVLVAAWSIWWEREYLERRAALWQAGQELVERGVPPEQIDGGFEWNGWYRGQVEIAAAVERRLADGPGRRLTKYVSQGLHRRMRWVVAYAPPRGAGSDRVLVEVPYWRGQRAVGIQRS